MNKHILTLFLSLTLLLSLAACGGNADTTDARRDANEIVVGIAQDLENSLDPYTSVTAANREVLFNVFEGLVKPDADGNLSPAVAERWEVSDDQLTYTFHLRPGVKFHDGSEVTAMDVAWSIDKAMQSGSWEALDNIDAIDIGSCAQGCRQRFSLLHDAGYHTGEPRRRRGPGRYRSVQVYLPRRAAESCAGALRRLLGREREGGQGHLSDL